MANQPGVALDVQIFSGIESAPLDEVAELDVCPNLAMCAHANVVIDVEATERVENAVAAEPTVATDLKRFLTMRESEGVDFRIVAQAKLWDDNARFATDIAEISQNHPIGRASFAGYQNAWFNTNAFADDQFTSTDFAFDARS